MTRININDLPPEVRARMGIKTPASKYKVKSKDTRTCDGIVFDSKAEMHWYRQLVDAKKHGVIKYFLRQVPFHLPGNVKYLCDFMVIYADGRLEYQDVKGMRTAMYRLKRKQVEALYPVKIREIEDR